ncbi:MAG: PaaI family thioesterase [Intrasporangium sp.]|nr:PaaI family thioesterase [Intrasporangium sp.]MDN5795778.1 PaaI family thioesterase [Intrasporangium sp.]
MTQNMTSEQPEAVRQRTYSWGDPQLFATAAQELDGLDFFAQLADGKFPPPPINETLGMALVDVGDGRAVFELTPEEWHYNPIGSVHGGILATLADSALGCAVHTKLSAGTGYTSLDLTIKFTRAATFGQRHPHLRRTRRDHRAPNSNSRSANHRQDRSRHRPRRRDLPHHHGELNDPVMNPCLSPTPTKPWTWGPDGLRDGTNSAHLGPPAQSSALSLGVTDPASTAAAGALPFPPTRRKKIT